MYSASSQQQQQQQYPRASAPLLQHDADRRSSSSSAMHNNNLYPTAAVSSEKQPSGYGDAHYPSFAASQQQQQQHVTAASCHDTNRLLHAQALPVYYSNRDSAQQPHPAHSQYNYPTHPTATAYEPAPHLPPPPQQYVSLVHSNNRASRRRYGYIGTTLQLMLFHVLNAVLSIGSFVFVVTGGSLAVGLVPLCCLGLVVFRVLLYVVGKLAKLDVTLYNYISPASEHVYVDIPQHASGHVAGERLAPQLTSFSPLAIMAALYFGTIKFAVGILSCVVVTLVGGLLATLAMVVTNTDIAGASPALVFGDREVHVRDSPGTFALVWLCTFVISVALMHVIARISRTSTRFFCCEKFSTYRYIHVPQQASTSVRYGTY